MSATRTRTADKVARLTGAGFTIRYADPREGHTQGYVRWSRVYAAAYMAEDLRPYVDLGDIGQGEDTYGQVGTVARSNYRSLLRDHPGLFVPTSYANVDSLGAFVRDLDDDMIARLIGLKSDYPLHDEEDLSALEADEIGEAFGQYLYADWHDYADPWSDVADRYERDEIHEAFYRAMSAGDYHPDHNGLDVLWDDAEVAALMQAALTALVRAEFAESEGQGHA